MANWILVVGYSRQHFEAAQREWLKYNVTLHAVNTVPEAIAQFTKWTYLAVIASYDLPDLILLIETMRESRQVPLMVLPQEDSGTKMAESIIRGADTFIIDVDNLVESIKNSEKLIENISRLSPHNKKALGILTHRDIFMLVDYRKVFVRANEITLTRSGFEILQLLLSHAGRVYTHEQLYLYAYGEDVATSITINAIRCHISRIRRRLRTDQPDEDYIDSVRSIGYRIAI